MQKKHVADSNSNLREDAHEAKKVYVGNKLAHVHVNDNTEFALRQTLNGYIHEDNDLYAKISKIKGNTKVWNQIVENWNMTSTNGFRPYSAILESSSNILKVTINATVTVNYSGYVNYQGSGTEVTDHKYYIQLKVRTPKTGSFRIDGGSQNTYVASITANVWTDIKTILGKKAFALYPLELADGYVQGDSYEIKDLNIIDLTLIYGAGNEPTTVAEFEADFQKWFGRPIGAEPYDVGSLIPFLSTGLKSVGFNLWDEEWEAGAYDGTTGEKIAVSNRIRSANYIKVIPSSTYYFRQEASRFVYMYDANKNYLSNINVTGTTFDVPANCCYITFQVGNSSNPITTYNNDICINLSNPTLNGTYVPYKATTVPIPVTTLTGKAEGSTTSEIIFPDGMKSAGSVKDEVYVENGKTYAIKRVGSVDLGTLGWRMGAIGEGVRFISDDIDYKNPGRNNILCSKYLINSTAFMGQGPLYSIGGYDFGKAVYVYLPNNIYSDTTTFKTAMSGVMLYYELATPIVYEVDNYTLPVYYVANGTGTEELQSTATSAPADMDIEYKLRQRVRLVDMGTPGVLWADSDIDITKPDGFCDSPFTYDKSFFSWGNVVGHNPISNTAFDYDWGDINSDEPWYEGKPYGDTPGNTLTGNIPADAQYDAAKAVLGGNWRIPNENEFESLFNVCKFLEADGSDMDTSKTDKRVDMPDGNGGTVKGIYIESTVTGNRLFFSCSGLGYDRSWRNRGSNGYYWSSAWNSVRYALYLYFNNGGVSPQSYNYRCNGFALRPVYPISQ